MSKKIKYPGFCMKYGTSKVMYTASFMPAILNVLIQFLKGAHVDHAESTSYGVYFASVAGFAFAMIAHHSLNKSLSKKGVGLSRGGGRL